VVIAGRSKKTLDEAVKTIGNGVLAVQADVSVAKDLDKLYATVSQKLGKIDIFVCERWDLQICASADTSEISTTNCSTSTPGASTSPSKKHCLTSMTALRSL